MPGLVRTKILANEPQPMRLFVQIMNKIISITPEKAADNIFVVINEISKHHKTGVCYAWQKEVSLPNMKIKKGDQEKLSCITNELLSSF